jgi:single-strand DNA-binding protein
MNKVYIFGRLGRDPELKTIGSGEICNFTIATTEKWRGSDGQKNEKTEWHRIVVFGKLAEACAKYLLKGARVMVEGKIQTRSWDDKDGVKKHQTEIIATAVTFIDMNDKHETGENEFPF